MNYDRAILTILLNQPHAYYEVGEFLRPEFFPAQSRPVFEAILADFRAGITPNLLTVKDTLRGLHADYLLLAIECSGGHYPSENIKVFSRKLAEAYISEKLRADAEIVLRLLQAGKDPLTVLDKAGRRITQLRGSLIAKNEREFGKSIPQIVSGLENRVREAKNKTAFIPTGFTELDQYIGGFRPGQVITVAGRTGMGKTAIALHFALSAKTRVGLFSLEMDFESIADRIIAQQVQIPLMAINAGRLNAEDFTKITRIGNELSEIQLIVDDTPSLHADNFKVRVRQMVMEHRVKLIVLDYLQLMTAPRRASREQEVSYMIQVVRQAARENHIPVISLSQLSRPQKGGESRRPVLSDLRDSGDIEQSSNLVMFLHRPDYYGEQTYEDGTPTAGTAEIIVAKNRQGKTGAIRVGFNLVTQKFEDLNQSYSFTPISNDDDTPF